MNTLKNICFYFPYKDDSGVPILFARMANELAVTNPDNIFYIIDYLDGAIARNVQPLGNIKLIEFHDDITVALPENSILIMQSFVPYHWPIELVPFADTKIFFWNLHPKNFIPSLLPITSLRDFTYNNFTAYKILNILFSRTIKNIRSFVKILIDHNAICFMDETNFKSTRQYLFLDDFKPDYLPVPVSNSDVGKKKDKIEQGTFNYCWIGRICDFKAYILVYTANKLAEIAKENSLNINYVIIGDGPFLTYVQDNIKENRYFKIKYEGVIPHTKINNFLLDKIDVVTAMGTSALESAKLGIPTILLDFSYKKIEGEYTFRNLYDTKNFDLGHSIDNSDIRPGNKNLEKIVLSIADDYNTEATLAYEYYDTNHNIKSIAVKFLKQIEKSNLKFGEINPKLLKKPKILEYYYKLVGLLH